LLSLSRMCRLLYAAAEPFRYHCVYLSRDWDLYYLLRTLVDRPDLAARVSDLDIGVINKTRLVGYDSSGPVSTTLAAVLEVLQNNGHGISQPQASAAEPTCHAVLTWSALQLIPNLGRLHLPTLGFASDAPFMSFMAASTSSSSSAPSQKTLAFSGLGPDSLLDQAGPIFKRAPNLEVLHCHHHAYATVMFPAALGRMSMADPQPMQNLTELALVDTPMTAHSFRSLLNAVGPKLSRVRIRLRPVLPDRPRGMPGSPLVLEFVEALGNLVPWCLRIKDFSFTAPGMVLPQPNRHLTNALPGMYALEILCAQAACFDLDGRIGPRRDALTSTLPASIRELKLVGHGKLAPALLGLVEALTAGRFARLRSIQVDEQDFGEEPARGQELQDAGALFRAAGVAFIIRPMDHNIGP